MPKVTAAQQREYEACVAAYEENIGNLISGIEDFNAAMGEEFERRVRPHLTATNEAIDELRQIAAEIRDSLQEYYDERSDSWQEGEKGQAYLEWVDSWAELDSLEYVDAEFVEVDSPVEESIEAETEVDLS